MRSVPPLLLFFFTFAVLFPGFGGEYLLLDDDDYITGNSYVKSGLSWNSIRWAFTETHSGHWHPLTWISLMVDMSLFGESSDASRVINVLLHASAITILFFPVKQLVGSSFVALLGCGIFAVHPLRLESVLWVSERKDVLAFFFFAIVVALYENSLRVGSVLSRRIAYPFALLGLFAKPSLVVLPLLLPLLDFVYSTEKLSLRFIRTCFIKMWLYLAFGAAISIAALIGQSAAGGLKSSNVLPLSERLNNAVLGYLAYIGKLFWPFDLSVFYPLQSLPLSIGIGGGLFILGITIVCVGVVHSGGERTTRLMSAAWFWFLAGLLPVIGIVQVGWQQFADRWTYIPHLLPVVALSHLYSTKVIRFRNVALCGGCTLLVLLSIESHQQSTVWLSSKQLFHQALQNTRQNFFIMTNLGVVYEREGESHKAIELYREALRYNSEYPLALNNLGAVFAKEGRYADSLIYFKKALTTFPQFTPARFHLGLALFRLEKPLAAAIEWSKVLQNNPGHQEAAEMFPVALKQLITTGCKPFEQVSVGSPEGLLLRQVADPTLFSQLSTAGCLTK
jgi:tetratricopeptide (TPR) repeat protein